MTNLFLKLIKNHTQKKGDLHNNLTKCLYCGNCQRCRTKAITVNREEKEWLWENDKCMRCGHCISQCPAKSLSFVKNAGM